jgi:hypothetical protein
MMDYAVDRETAELEFERWADAMRIDMDVDGQDDEDALDTESHKRKIVKAIMDGRLVISEAEGFAVFTPPGKDPISFSKVNEDIMGAVDRVKIHKGKDPQVQKMYAMLATWSGTSIVTFAKMHQADKKVCMALVTLFLAQ